MNWKNDCRDHWQQKRKQSPVAEKEVAEARLAAAPEVARGAVDQVADRAAAAPLVKAPLVEDNSGSPCHRENSSPVAWNR
jgi:hypothetical protein